MLELHHYNNLKTSKTALFLRFSLQRLNQADISAELLRILAPLSQGEAVTEDMGFTMTNFTKLLHLTCIVSTY